MKLTKEQIEIIADLTDRNFHTNARLKLISCLNQKNDLSWAKKELLQDGYNFIESQHIKLQCLPEHLSTMRRNLDSLLKEALFKFVSNADQVWQAL